MFTNQHIAFASAIIALVALIGSAHAQPAGPNPGRGWGWMGPGMMDARSFRAMCGPRATGFAEWQISRIEQLIKPTDAQRAKFEEYKAAATKAAVDMRSGCPTAFPATMVARMEAMEKRTEAMLQAVRTVRPTLEAFYATLSEEQKNQLNSNSGPGRMWRWRDSW